MESDSYGGGGGEVGGVRVGGGVRLGKMRWGAVELVQGGLREGGGVALNSGAQEGMCWDELSFGGIGEGLAGAGVEAGFQLLTVDSQNCLPRPFLLAVPAPPSPPEHYREAPPHQLRAGTR